MRNLILFLSSILIFQPLLSQTMDFEEYDPESTLVVPGKEITKAKYPFVDIHNHQFRMPDMDLNELIVEMDKLNMATMVNLSGRGFVRTESGFDLNTQEYLARAIKNADGNYPGRFAVFTNVSFANFGKEGWTEEAVRQLEEAGQVSIVRGDSNDVFV